MTLAVNDAGDVLSDESGTWKPALRAVNDKTGENLVLDGGAWKPLPGAKAVPDTTPAPAAAPAPDMNPAQTEFPTYAAPAPTEPAPGNAAVQRVGSAAKKAFMDTETILTPYAEDLVNKGGPIGRYITNPALHAVDVAHGAANAGMAALAQSAMELFGEKGGRDLLAFASSLPMAPEASQLSAMRANSPENLAKAPTPTAPTAESFPQSTPLAELDTRNAIQKLLEEQIHQENPDLAPLGTANQGTPIAAIGAAPDIDTAIAAAGEAAQSPAPRDWMTPLRDRIVAQAKPAEAAPAMEDAIPQSVGAAASRDQTPQGLVDLSDAAMKANRYQAEMKELLSPPEPNDRTIYVANSFPTKAEYSGDPTVSQQEHLLRERKPEAFVGEGKRLTENNNARVAEFESQTPSRTALQAMMDARSAQWEADSNGILPTAKPVDFSPALDWVDGQLSNPKIRENDAVRAVLENFRDRLVNDDGSPKTDPAAAWGIHDNIQNQLAKAKDPLNATGAEKFAFTELMQAKQHVDAALNAATDNKFQVALENYAKASQVINAGQELEAFRPKLTNGSGTIMADRFHRFVVDLAQRRGDPGIDPAMNISDETMRSLINIDNDLKRAGLIKLGGALGSPTNLLGALAQKIGISTAHRMLGKVPAVGPVLEGAADYLANKKLESLVQEHLAPPEGGFVPLTP